MTTPGWRYFVEIQGRETELPEGELAIGRSRSCAIALKDVTVSRHHATLFLERGQGKLRDNGSSNGTFLNGRKVEGELAVVDGDRIVVGESELVVRLVAPEATEATVRIELGALFCDRCGAPLPKGVTACVACGLPVPGMEETGAESRAAKPAKESEPERVAPPAPAFVQPATEPAPPRAAPVKPALEPSQAVSPWGAISAAVKPPAAPTPDAGSSSRPAAPPRAGSESPSWVAPSSPPSPLDQPVASRSIPAGVPPPAPPSRPMPWPMSPPAPSAPATSPWNPPSSPALGERPPGEALRGFELPPLPKAPLSAPPPSPPSGRPASPLDEAPLRPGPPASTPALPSHSPARSPSRPELLPSIHEAERTPAPHAASRGPVPQAIVRPAGFWIRVGAMLIDSAIVAVLAMVGLVAGWTSPVLGMAMSPLVLVVALAMPLVGWAMWGVTPGKALLGLAVCTPEGTPGQGIGWAKALLRLVGYFVSSLLLGAGYLMVAFTSGKRGLHDLIAGTYVARR